MSLHLFQQSGPAGLVAQVDLATQHGLTQLAETALRAMTHIQSLADRRAAFQANGPMVIAQCLATFPNSLPIAHAALTAGLLRAWNGGVAPFHGAPTERVVKVVVKAMQTFKTALVLIQGGLRLLKLHTSSQYHLVETPAVVETAAAAMRRWPADMTVQHYAAAVISAINGVEPKDLKEAHGEMGYNSIAVTSVALAVSMPPSLQIQGQPWQQLVLTCYPKLRLRA